MNTAHILFFKSTYNKDNTFNLAGYIFFPEVEHDDTHAALMCKTLKETQDSSGQTRLSHVCFCIYKAGIVCAQNKQNKGSQVRRTKKESY